MLWMLASPYTDAFGEDGPGYLKPVVPPEPNNEILIAVIVAVALVIAGGLIALAIIKRKP